jgi:hypothetical protein
MDERNSIYVINNRYLCSLFIVVLIIAITIMERIVLEVGGRMASAWRNSSPVFKSRMEKEIQLQIRRRLKEERQVEFRHALNEVRDETTANGLTEEILEQILHEEE